VNNQTCPHCKESFISIPHVGENCPYCRRRLDRWDRVLEIVMYVCMVLGGIVFVIAWWLSEFK